MQHVGRIRNIYRYPVKSMAGEALDTARLGWHGVEGDRRFSFRRSTVQSGMPWLTAGRLAGLLAYVPMRPEGSEADAEPTVVRTPRGELLGLSSDALRDELTAANGAPVDLIHMNNGIFDDAAVSVLTSATVAAIGAGAGSPLNVLRFRPNFYIDTDESGDFPEDGWVGKTLAFGSVDGPAVNLFTKDIRCSMINLDPLTTESDPRVLKAAVRLNDNCAGLYATVIRTGQVAVGDDLFLS